MGTAEVAAATVTAMKSKRKKQRNTPPLSNKKASNKKLDSQISYFNRISRDLITKSNENSLLRDKKSRPSLEKSSFLLDRGGVRGASPIEMSNSEVLNVVKVPSELKRYTP